MRYKDLILDKVEKIQQFLNGLDSSVSRGDIHSYNEYQEKIKSLLEDINLFVSHENQD